MSGINWATPGHSAWTVQKAGCRESRPFARRLRRNRPEQPRASRVSNRYFASDGPMTVDLLQHEEHPAGLGERAGTGAIGVDQDNTLRHNVNPVDGIDDRSALAPDFTARFGVFEPALFSD